MANIKGRGTLPERTVALYLKQLGIRFRRNVKSLPGQPDFVVSSRKTVIFVQGCFWHGHTNCTRAKIPQTNSLFWSQKIEKNRTRDARTTRLLRKKKWHVLTIWQCRIRDKKRILTHLKRFLTPQIR